MVSGCRVFKTDFLWESSKKYKKEKLRTDITATNRKIFSYTVYKMNANHGMWILWIKNSISYKANKQKIANKD